MFFLKKKLSYKIAIVTVIIFSLLLVFICTIKNQIAPMLFTVLMLVGMQIKQSYNKKFGKLNADKD